jgi:hypothetical protein
MKPNLNLAERFATATPTVPEPCFILGTAMKPFSLGHHILLKRLNLPFCGNPLFDAGNDDLMIGIAICGQSYDETLEQLLDGTWPKVFEDWLSQLKSKKTSQTTLVESEVLFRAYLSDGYKRPPVWRHDIVKGITLSAPWEMLLKNRLVMAGYREHEVVNGYLPARWYDYYTVSELDAAARCGDASKWRKVFYTREDAEVADMFNQPDQEEK